MESLTSVMILLLRQPLQELQRVMKERFAESEFLAGVPEKLGGAICMQVIRWCMQVYAGDQMVC